MPLLKIELEAYKLLEVEFETYKVRKMGDIKVAMADGMIRKISDPLSISINWDVNANAGFECLSCARLKQELRRATRELESVTEIIRILSAEMFISVKEVKDATCDEYSKSNGSKVMFQAVNNQIDEQAAVVEELTHKEKDSPELNARMDNGIEALSESKETYKVTDRTNEQHPTSYNLYDSSGSKHHSSLPKRSESAMKHIPVIVNAEIVMEKGGKDTLRIRSECSKRFENNNYNRLNKANKHKISLMGDSHSRGNVINISHHLGSNFDLFGVIKPGASIIDIVPQNTVNYRHLTKKDVILIQAGSNDVYRNNSKTALMQIKNVCEILSSTNIILLDITHRYNLIETSCVNKEIQSYNRKLKKVVKLYKLVTILEASNNREDFTRKGLYLNKSRKRQL
jgi:hypothetical protein